MLSDLSANPMEVYILGVHGKLLSTYAWLKLDCCNAVTFLLINIRHPHSTHLSGFIAGVAIMISGFSSLQAASCCWQVASSVKQ